MTVAVLVTPFTGLMTLVTAGITLVRVHKSAPESVIMSLAKGSTLMDPVGAPLILASMDITTR